MKYVVYTTQHCYFNTAITHWANVWRKFKSLKSLFNEIRNVAHGSRCTNQCTIR